MIVRATTALVLLVGVGYAAWWIAWYAGVQTSGATLPPPPGF